MRGDGLFFDAMYVRRLKLVLTVGCYAREVFSPFHCVGTLLLDVLALVSCVRESYFTTINLRS
jgi:hypothetical protein